MENFIVSARKYRPQTFEDVVGQQHVTQTLARAIEHNHLAQALLFTGPRGVGKTTCARILARMINASEDHDPEQDFSFNVFELDAASNNSVEDIRSLTDQVRYAPQTGKYKVYIIDEVHMLSQAAFNAFLKTLEEPPKHAIFILATTEKHKIIPTILSRCQIYDFKRITVEDISEHLKGVAQKEGISTEPEALTIIAQKADGALRDALSIFDRLVSSAGDSITYKDVIDNLRVLDYDYYFRATDLMLQGDLPGLLLLFDEILDNGYDPQIFLNGLASHFRDLLVCRDERTLSLLEVSESTRDRYREQSKYTSTDFLMEGLKMMNECDVRFRGSNNQRLLVELCLLNTATLLHAAAEKKNTKPEQLIKSNPAPKPEVQVNIPNPDRKTQIEVKSTPAPAKPAAAPKAPIEVKNSITEKNTEPEVVTKSSNGTAAVVDSPVAVKTPKKTRLGISISAALDEDDETIVSEEEEVDEAKPKEGPRDIFTETQLNNYWKEYLDMLKENEKKRIFISLSSATLHIKENNVLEIGLHSEAQRSSFEEVKHEVLRFLRSKLNNFALVFEDIMSVQEKNLEPYSPQEKFEYMVQKNPHLLTLKQKLDLDLE